MQVERSGFAMYLRRKAYDGLAAWKKRPNHSALEVSGARQVGNAITIPIYGIFKELLTNYS